MNSVQHLIQLVGINRAAVELETSVRNLQDFQSGYRLPSSSLKKLASLIITTTAAVPMVFSRDPRGNLSISHGQILITVPYDQLGSLRAVLD